MAGDGPTALEAAATSAGPVVLDLVLPGLDGLGCPRTPCPSWTASPSARALLDARPVVEAGPACAALGARG